MEKKTKQVVALIAALVLAGSFIFFVPKVLAATGGGTGTIGVDGGAQGAGVTVVQSTSHIFTTVFTVNVSGYTLGAASPTFTIPTGFTAPNANPVATAVGVDTDGEWSVVAGTGSCVVDSAPGSATTLASGQVITVDITASCADGDTITLTYKGTSATAMGATALTISTADAGDAGPVTPLIAGSPTITVTAAATPTPAPTSASSGSSSSSSSSSSDSSPVASVITTVPIILESRRVSPTSVFVSWGPYAGESMFIIQYGLTNGSWSWSTTVTGFSTTISNLPPNQPIWVRLAATNRSYTGTYGVARLVGGPGLPNTGFGPDNNIPWYIIMFDVIYWGNILLLKI